MGVQSMGVDLNRNPRCAICARMVGAASSFFRSVWRLTAHLIFSRTDHHPLRTSLTTRRICGMAADGPHDSTSTVDDGRTAPHPRGPPSPATSLRASAAIFDRWGRAISFVCWSPQDSSFCIAPSYLLVSFHLNKCRVACAGDV